MNYTLQQLINDVMGSVGETAGPSPSAIPGPAETIALRVESLLPEVGRKLLLEAPLALLGEGEALTDSTMTLRLMPCGLYAAEVALPEDFVRLVSVKMEGWEREIGNIIYIGEEEWGCQWSEEAGIAGCPVRPRGYVAAGVEGRVLRLVGSVAPTDALEWLRGWRLPYGDAFSFPAPLYPPLVKEISSCLV